MVASALDYANMPHIRSTLYRLWKDGKIQKVAHGIYRAVADDGLGILA